MRGILSLGAVLAAILAVTGPQDAAAGTACSSWVEGRVSSTSDCELGSTSNDRLNPLQVNEDEIFGYNDWIFAEKAFDNDQDLDIGLSVYGNNEWGWWWFDDIWETGVEIDGSTFSVMSVMLVLKGPASRNTDPGHYAAYMVDEDATYGTYRTPFRDGREKKDISHISAYIRVDDGSTEVSEPAMLLPFGLGLLALTGLYARRRRG